MKTYSIPSAPENENVLADNRNTKPSSNKSRKTAFVVIILAITGFLIIKLKQSDTQAATVASVAIIEKKNTAVKTSVQLKEKRRKKETANPSSYIKTKIKWRKNLVGGIVLEGSLTNTATLANFKDPVITITWLSKTNTALATTTHPLYEYLGAKKTIAYKLKVKAPSKFVSINASVESATAL